eukprot:CAMPEP_0116878274 /NCGR_PEP_ID=MMETSP0463-20121206/10004_1 /TAXON_ID=181622 /ORGANISM="Strombidinopsis sp, Strain SopsisLIS2011" /LENGTH=96 /DNA_ID=CAMNT_0004526291 /DNA_START=117 /DNA_END=405 /DNA_ORIENTATION=-
MTETALVNTGASSNSSVNLKIGNSLINSSAFVKWVSSDSCVGPLSQSSSSNLYLVSPNILMLNAVILTVDGIMLNADGLIIMRPLVEKRDVLQETA